MLVTVVIQSTLYCNNSYLQNIYMYGGYVQRLFANFCVASLVKCLLGNLEKVMFRILSFCWQIMAPKLTSAPQAL